MVASTTENLGDAGCSGRASEQAVSARAAHAKRRRRADPEHEPDARRGSSTRLVYTVRSAAGKEKLEITPYRVSPPTLATKYKY